MYYSSAHLYILFTSHYTPSIFFFFFFNDTATTEIYTLSLHDALPISLTSLNNPWRSESGSAICRKCRRCTRRCARRRDRKSTRLNSSHVSISYAVFCLKKKKKKKKININTHKLQYTLNMQSPI